MATKSGHVNGAPQQDLYASPAVTMSGSKSEAHKDMTNDTKDQDPAMMQLLWGQLLLLQEAMNTQNCNLVAVMQRIDNVDGQVESVLRGQSFLKAAVDECDERFESMEYDQYVRKEETLSVAQYEVNLVSKELEWTHHLLDQHKVQLGALESQVGKLADSVQANDQVPAEAPQWTPRCRKHGRVSCGQCHCGDSAMVGAQAAGCTTPSSSGDTRACQDPNTVSTAGRSRIKKRVEGQTKTKTKPAIACTYCENHVCVCVQCRYCSRLVDEYDKQHRDGCCEYCFHEVRPRDLAAGKRPPPNKPVQKCPQCHVQNIDDTDKELRRGLCFGCHMRKR